MERVKPKRRVKAEGVENVNGSFDLDIVEETLDIQKDHRSPLQRCPSLHLAEALHATLLLTAATRDWTF